VSLTAREFSGLARQSVTKPTTKHLFREGRRPSGVQRRDAPGGPASDSDCRHNDYTTLRTARERSRGACNSSPTPPWRRARCRPGNLALVSGTAGEEKGFDTATCAARAAMVPLVGGGEARTRRGVRAFGGRGEVRFTGRLAPQELAQLGRSAAVGARALPLGEPCPYAALGRRWRPGVPVLATPTAGCPSWSGPRACLRAQEPIAGRGPARAVARSGHSGVSSRGSLGLPARAAKRFSEAGLPRAPAGDSTGAERLYAGAR